MVNVKTIFDLCFSYGIYLKIHRVAKRNYQEIMYTNIGEHRDILPSKSTTLNLERGRVVQRREIHQPNS